MTEQDGHRYIERALYPMSITHFSSTEPFDLVTSNHKPINEHELGLAPLPSVPLYA